MSRFFTWRRSATLALGGLALGFTLACSGLTDSLKGMLADQFEQAIADAMGIDPSEVEITPLDNGRWAMDSPDWDAECGIGPSTKRPAGFFFETGPEIIADCTVNAADCKDVLGVPCDENGADIQLVAQIHKTATGNDLIGKRTAELEGKGLDVVAAKDPDNPDATMLTARKGKTVRAVAMVVRDKNGGGGTEVLVAPAKKKKAP